MTAKTANRISRLWNHLVRGAALALFAILVVTLLGVGSITIYGISVGAFTPGLPQPLPPGPEPAAPQIAAIPQWRITQPIVIGVHYNNGWSFARILMADITDNGGVIDDFKPRYFPLSSVHITARVPRSYAEQLLAKTRDNSHLTPGYRTWQTDTVAPDSGDAGVAVRITVKQRIYPNRALADAAIIMAIIAAYSAVGILTIAYCTLRNGKTDSAGTQTESAEPAEC